MKQVVILLLFLWLLFDMGGSAYHWGYCNMVIESSGVVECGYRAQQVAVEEPHRRGMTVMITAASATVVSSISSSVWDAEIATGAGISLLEDR